MRKSLFFAEWKQIFSNKKVLIPVLAVICVPILYAGMFLWAFWDPYAQLEDLPVAVVNQDKGAVYEGTELELGKQLVDNLKDNESFQFHFVSKEEGYQDLKNQNYYMLIEIPENFSENATTILEDEPKKLELKYVPNESHNFLSGQIGETAVKEIKSAISKEVTATYAETIFDKVTEMANGFDQASDGAGELQDGAKQLNEGANTLYDNLAVLASKSLEFTEGVNRAQTGSAELATGSSELAKGVGQLADGSNQLLAASKDVQSGSEQIASGASEVNAGLTEMDEKLPQLVAGSNQVKAGLQQFQNELPTQLADSIGEQLQSSMEEMNTGLDQLQSQLSSQMAAELASQISSQQEAQMTQLFAALQQADVNPTVLNAVKQQLEEQSPTRAELEKQLHSAIHEGMGQGFTQYKTVVNEQLTGSTGQLEAEVKAATEPTFSQLINGVQTLHDAQVQLQDGVQQLAAGSNQLYDGAMNLSSGQKEYVSNFVALNEKLSDAKSGASQLASGANLLTNGMSELSNGSVKIGDGTRQLADGSKELADGTVVVEDGTTEMKEALEDAAEQAGSVEADNGTYDMMGEPVKVQTKGINHVPNYGTGFAPYFLSLGLFVGALLISIVYQLKMPAVRPRNGVAWFFGKFGVITIVGVIQALLADAILLLGLGIEVQSVPLFLVTSIIISLTFMALIQFFVTTLGDPGRFMAIIILILQLTTSAGTFPLELIPKALQPISAFLPMTYTVQALKAVVSSGDFAYMWSNIIILLAYLIGFAILTMIFFVIQFKSKRDLLPEQEAA
ncbi:YhgE/Pip domain-containing protein [Mesobacillus maritimus]|uniref:YhgE/Pip domain-containing protein n=1 Tax=Mesobacillus maritimus TaxID=1643336 RepID=UPI00203F9F41|nr:YhgE/Pip domain-containing protein [Mesobacillus maritimus]MCM3587532.1 YhgE/Pip domain-containing protein [Mesobacillus maritimus]